MVGPRHRVFAGAGRGNAIGAVFQPPQGCLRTGIDPAHWEAAFEESVIVNGLLITMG